MANVISIITPVHEPAAVYLRSAYESILRQELPENWSWEWIVQEDGETQAVFNWAPNAPNVKPGFGPQGGPAITRNLAVGRSVGDLIKVLDADDQLAPGALASDIETLTTQPEVEWTTSKALDMADGKPPQEWHGPSIAEGRIELLELFESWRSNGYIPLVHPATLCIRRRLLLALGGWMGLPSSEDTGLLLSANVVSYGWYSNQPGLYYRKWSGQKTAQDDHYSQVFREERSKVIEQRVASLHNTNFGNLASLG